jgi:two-component system chemotaxis sensor kinase CheA
MDVILKPLEGLLSGVPGLAGSTLLGDGSVLLVLDLGELVR